MPMSGFICHDDYYDRLKRLTDEEVGHLFRQLMLYHAGRHDEMTDFIGSEGIAYDFIVSDIARIEKKQDETSEINRLNGLKGGRPKKQTEAEETPNNQLKPTETEKNRTKPTETDENRQKGSKDKEKDKDKDKDIDDDNNARTREDSSMISLEEATRIRNEHEAVLNAAETAGFPRTDAVRSKLISLYAEHGMEKMLSAINSCVEYGVTTIAYLKGVLKGEPKRPTKPPTKTVIAQQYSQRDYATDPDYKAWEERNQRELERKIAEMEARKAEEKLKLSG